jgi:hypothetical protein
MTWGMESNVIERFGTAGVPKDSISFVRDTYTFRFASRPAELVDAFRKYYGPTMNAFDAAEKNGRSEDLKKELDDLFMSQNESPVADATLIPATYLRVTVARWGKTGWPTYRGRDCASGRGLVTVAVAKAPAAGPDSGDRNLAGS